MTRDEEGRAKFAETLLHNDFFRGLLADMKSETIRDWASAGTTEKREQLHGDLLAIGRLENRIRAAASDLIVERKKDEIAEARAKRKEQVKNGGRPR